MISQIIVSLIILFCLAIYSYWKSNSLKKLLRNGTKVKAKIIEKKPATYNQGFPVGTNIIYEFFDSAGKIRKNKCSNQYLQNQENGDNIDIIYNAQNSSKNYPEIQLRKTLEFYSKKNIPIFIVCAAIFVILTYYKYKFRYH